jgi:hypothetical protein
MTSRVASTAASGCTRTSPPRPEGGRAGGPEDRLPERA